MDLNLKFWKSEGKVPSTGEIQYRVQKVAKNYALTFSQRFYHWLDILDPSLLFKSKEEIETSRALILTTEPDITESLKDEEIKAAWQLSLASVNPATGDMIPAAFRPPAFLPLTFPLVYGILLPHQKVTHTFVGQSLFYMYTGIFNFTNGNFKEDSKEVRLNQVLLSAGATLYCASMGAFPHFIMNRYQVQSPSLQMLLKKIIPGPLTAFLCAFNVLINRGTEYENGIEIMDRSGKVVGVSKNAARKAVKETALSRAATFGAAMCIPEIVLPCLKRMNIFGHHPFFWIHLKSMVMLAIFGLMTPVSFSLFPQLGMIQRSLIEPDVISSTEETEFFYNRGL